MAAAEVALACGSAMIGGGVGSALTMLLWARLHRDPNAAPAARDSFEDDDLDDRAWAASRVWAERRGRPEAAGFAVGYVRDTAEYLISRRRKR